MARRFIVLLVLVLVALDAVALTAHRAPTRFDGDVAAAVSPGSTAPPALIHRLASRPAPSPRKPAPHRAAAVKRRALVAAKPARHVAAPPPARVIHPATPTTVARPAPTVPSAAMAASAAPPPLGPCAQAVSYLSAHAAPGFGVECPGYADGRQAMTCMNIPGLCPGQRIIILNVACPASWMNEASNSWVILGLASTVIDPYGSCP